MKALLQYFCTTSELFNQLDNMLDQITCIYTQSIKLITIWTDSRRTQQFPVYTERRHFISDRAYGSLEYFRPTLRTTISVYRNQLCSFFTRDNQNVSSECSILCSCVIYICYIEVPEFNLLSRNHVPVLNPPSVFYTVQIIKVPVHCFQYLGEISTGCLRQPVEMSERFWLEL